MATSPTRPADTRGPAAPAGEAWALLMRFFHDHGRPRFLRLAADLELSPPQLMALHRLDAGEPLPMNHLAEQLHCDNSNVTGIVDRLEDRGLVARRVADHDRRVKMLVLTDEGRRLRERIAERMADPPAALERLTATEAVRLRDLLAKALG